MAGHRTLGEGDRAAVTKFREMTEDELIRHAAGHAGASAQGALGELARRGIDATDRLGAVVRQQTENIGQLVHLAEIERDARLAAEQSHHRWQIVFLVLGVLTFLAAIGAILVTI